MTKLEKVLFQGDKYLLVGGDSLTTREAYENGTASYAHVFPDGVYRYGEKIGEISEVTHTGKFVEVHDGDHLSWLGQ